jgi:hypothetical protein
MSKPNKVISKTITVKDRLALPAILKTETNYATLIINRDIKNKVELNQEELEKFQVRFNQDGTLSLHKDAQDITFKYDFTEAEVTEIRTRLKDLDKEEKLLPIHENLYQQFAL